MISFTLRLLLHRDRILEKKKKKPINRWTEEKDEQIRRLKNSRLRQCLYSWCHVQLHNSASHEILSPYFAPQMSSAMVQQRRTRNMVIQSDPTAPAILRNYNNMTWSLQFPWWFRWYWGRNPPISYTPSPSPSTISPKPQLWIFSSGHSVMDLHDGEWRPSDRSSFDCCQYRCCRLPPEWPLRRWRMMKPCRRIYWTWFSPYRPIAMSSVCLIHGLKIPGCNYLGLMSTHRPNINRIFTEYPFSIFKNMMCNLRVFIPSR